jgi:hypothetical protein
MWRTLCYDRTTAVAIRNGNVLVVEDDDTIRRLLVEILSA